MPFQHPIGGPEVGHNPDKPGKKCPQCGEQMPQVSRDFRPPKASKAEQWAALKVLADAGEVPLHTHGCGCAWHPVVPHTVAQAQDQVANGRIYLNRDGTVNHRGKPLVGSKAPRLRKQKKPIGPSGKVFHFNRRIAPAKKVKASKG